MTNTLTYQFDTIENLQTFMKQMEKENLVKCIKEQSNRVSVTFNVTGVKAIKIIEKITAMIGGTGYIVA